MNSPPCQSRQVTPRCKKSSWMTPLHTIGLQNAVIALAKDPAHDDTLSILEQITRRRYFIGSLEEFHAEHTPGTPSGPA